MEVLLKKTKITKSIIIQCPCANHKIYLNHYGYNVLGWVLVTGKKSFRYIVLYNETTNQLFTLPYSKCNEVSIKSQGRQMPLIDGGYEFQVIHELKLYLPDWNNTITVFESKIQDETEKAKTNLLLFLKEVELKGQIYI